MDRNAQDPHDILFAEKFAKVTFRDFTNNTMFSVKNGNFQERKAKRDRMMNYWHKNVSVAHLPSIDETKRAEMLAIKEANEVHNESKIKSHTPPRGRGMTSVMEGENRGDWSHSPREGQ